MVLNSYFILSHKVFKLVSSSRFQKTIISLIIFSSILLGLETNLSIMSTYGTYIKSINEIIVYIFTIEILLRLISYGPTPQNYFKDGWNFLDFLIVIFCLIPSGSNAMAVFRLIRVLRVFRLVTALPKLQIIISGMLKSIPSTGYVILLLSLQFYMFSVLGVFLFSKNDPINFGSLSSSMLTLFQTLTLEGWIDFLRIQMYGCANYGYAEFQNQCLSSEAKPVVSVVYFISFIILGTMFILNLLIGAIVNGMSESHDEAMNINSNKKKDNLNESIALLSTEIKYLREKLEEKEIFKS